MLCTEILDTDYKDLVEQLSISLIFKHSILTENPSKEGEENPKKLELFGHLLQHLVVLLVDLVNFHVRCTLPTRNNTRRLVQ